MSHSLTRRDFLASTALISAAAATSVCVETSYAQAAKSLPYVATLKVKNPADIRILQVTDLHLYGSPRRELGKTGLTSDEILAKLIENTKPDLLMITGDVWPENPNGRGYQLMMTCIDRFEKLGIPWAYTWGNHDQLSDYQAGHDAFAAAKHCLYRGDKTDGDYVIDLVDDKDVLLSQLICLNSHGEGLSAANQSWMKTIQPEILPASGKAPLRLAFFHIPVKQYDDVWASGAASGIMAEKPCIEKEDGSALPVIKALGVSACFVGHDHVNDYSGVYDGVELVYGRATGTGGYGAPVVRKGGKLISINGPAQTYGWTTVMPGGETWKPTPGKQEDRSDQKE